MTPLMMPRRPMQADMEHFRREANVLKNAVDEMDHMRKQTFELEQQAKTQRSRADALQGEVAALRSEMEHQAASLHSQAGMREERLRNEYTHKVAMLQEDLKRANPAVAELQVGAPEH